MGLPLLTVSNGSTRGASGVRSISILEGAGIGEIGFNTIDQIDLITLKAGYSLIKIEFEIGQASFKQNKTRSNGFPQVTQTLLFEHEGIRNSTMRGIRRLALHCDLHAIVETNQDQYFYMGISFYPDKGYYWDSGNCAIESGSVDVDKLGGEVRIATTLQATVRDFAPEIIADISVLPIVTPPPPPIVVDTVAPSAIQFIPPDDSVGLGLSPTVKIIFNEAVKAGTGNLVIKEYDTDTPVLTVDLSSNAGAQFSNAEASMTILSTISLTAATHYYITVDAGAITDLSGNAWPGISNKDDWDFYTAAAADTTAPTLVSLVPADDSNGINPVALTATITLNEDIQAGIGNFYVYDYDTDALLGSVSAISATISGAAATIDISAFVTTDKHYYILIPSGVIEDLAGNAFAGFSAKEDWDFETDDTGAPTPLTYFPASAEADASINTEMYIDFGEVIQLGSAGTIHLVRGVGFDGLIADGGTDVSVKSWDVSTTVELTITESGTRLNFTGLPTLAHNSLYYFRIPTGAVEDTSGNSIQEHYLGVSGSTVWFFTISELLAINLVAVDGGTLSCINISYIHFGYGRSFGRRKGFIKVFDWDTDELIYWMDIQADSGVVTIPGYEASTQLVQGMKSSNAYTNETGEVRLLGIPIPASNHIYITMTDGLFYDPVHSIDIAIPQAKGDWDYTFTSVGAGSISLANASPGDGETFAVTDEGDPGHIKLFFTLSDRAYHSGSRANQEDLHITFTDFDTGVLVAKLPGFDDRNLFITGARNVYEGGTEWRMVLPEGALDKAKKYTVSIPAGLFTNRCGHISTAMSYVIQGADYVAGTSDGFTTGFSSGFN